MRSESRCSPACEPHFVELAFVGVLVVAALLLLPASSGALPFAYSACLDSPDQGPLSFDEAFCVVDTAVGRKDLSEGAAALLELRSASPENPWVWWASGYLEVHRDVKRSDPLFDRALTLSEEVGSPTGVVAALDQIARRHHSEGRFDEAEAAVARAKKRASESKDELLVGWAKVIRGRHLWRHDRNIGEALTLARQAEAVIEARGPYLLRRDCLLLSASMSLGHQDFSKTSEYYDRLEALALSAERKVDVAVVDYYRAALEETRASALGLDIDVLDGYRRALASAQEAGSTHVMLWAHTALGDHLASAGESPEQAKRHYQSCSRLARELNDPQSKLRCYHPLTALLTQTDPLAALKALDEAEQLALRLGNARAVMKLKWLRIEAAWRAGPRQRAIEESIQALEELEEFRKRQRLPGGRAAAFAEWTEAYQIVAGYLLGGPSRVPDSGDTHLAFEIIERMRSRVLLDRLSESNASNGLASLNSSDRLPGLWREMAHTRRRLLDLRISGDERQDLLERLERLEITEAATLHELAVDQPAIEQEFVSLEQLSEALGPNEALFSFQLSDWRDHGGYFAGGAWLNVTTKGGSKIYPLPGRQQLRPAIEMHRGFFEYRDESERSTASSLYRMLLADAVEELPPEVERLILVPDGVLHQLPFASLRPDPEAPPLISKYELVTEPSATLWWRWRRRPRTSESAGVLALADPAVGAGSDGPRLLRVGLPSGEPLARLRHARREGRWAVKAAPVTSRLLTGRSASERALAEMDLAPFSVVHFAAHTMIDPEHPTRSAVLLAPGADDEDGWLLPREIVELELGGKVVVLSVCQSAAGRVLQGEGVMSPAPRLLRGRRRHGGGHVVAAP